MLHAACNDPWRHCLGCIWGNFPVRPRAQILGHDGVGDLHGCRDALLVDEHYWNRTRLGGVALANTRRGEAQVAAETEIGPVGSVWTRGVVRLLLHVDDA